MNTLSRAAAAMTMSAVLATQPGCLTRALVGLGENSNPASPPIRQPVSYIGAQREGRILHLEYDTSIDADGKKRTGKFSSFRVDMGKLQWQAMGPAPMDPYCTSNMWMQLLPNAAPQPRPPLFSERVDDIGWIAGFHKQYATGFPPISVHNKGLDTLIVCGAGDWIGYARAPVPPAPHPGSDGTRHPGYIVAIVVLFPFALAVDIVGGVFYVAACMYGNC